MDSRRAFCPLEGGGGGRGGGGADTLAPVLHMHCHFGVNYPYLRASKLQIL